MLASLAKLFKPAASARPGELFVGVEKPTTTLAKMMAVTITEELPEAQNDSRDHDYNSYFKYKTSKFDITRVHSDSRRKRVGSPYYTQWEMNVPTFPGVSFDKAECNIIGEALSKVNQLLAAKRAAKAEEKKQHSAVDAIAAWVGVPEEEKEKVE